MPFSYSAWMPVKAKHDLTEMAKFARAMAKGQSYVRKPYVHVKGRLIATMDSADLAKLKADAGLNETRLVQDSCTWSMKPVPVDRNCTRHLGVCGFIPEHDCGAMTWEWKPDAPPPPPVVVELARVVEEVQAAVEQLPQSKPNRSVAGKERVDCTVCGKRHYVRVRPCGERKAA